MKIFLVCLLSVSLVFANDSQDSVEEVEFRNVVSDIDDDPKNINIDFKADGQDFSIKASPNDHVKPDAVPTMFVGKDGKARKQEPTDKTKVFDTHDFFGGVLNDTFALLKRKASTGHLSGHVERNGVVYELEQASANTLMVRKKREASKNLNLNLSELKDYAHEHGVDNVVVTRGGRVKRSGTIVAGVETLVMVDYSLWKKFLAANNQDRDAAENEIKQYYAYIIHGVDLRYQNIEDPSINIFLTLAGYVIADAPRGSFWYDDNKVSASERDQVDVDLALSGLSDYMRSSRSTLPEHDHAMSFSDLDFGSRSSGLAVAGYAPVSGICSSTRAISLTESHGGLNCINTAAHELGHNLGASHDGSAGHQSCSPNANNIMSPGGGSESLENQFFFSSCSVQDFKDTLANAQCVKDQATHGDKATWDKHMANLPGQLYSADEQCKQLYGATSSQCGQWIYSRKGYDLCYALWCDNGSGCGSHLNSAARGTDCGDGRWCIGGKCVAKDSSHTGSRPTPSSGGSNNPPTTRRTTTTTTRATTTTTQAQGGSCTDKYSRITYNNVPYTCPQLTAEHYGLCDNKEVIGDWCCASCANTVPTCSDNSGFSVTITYSSGQRVNENCAGFVNALPRYCGSSYYKNKCCASCTAAGY